MNVNWTKSTLGDSLSLIRNGVNCKQDKSGIGDKISRIETIASAQVNLERVGFSILTKEQKEKYKLQQGDILFSHINSTVHVGKTAYIDDDYPLYHGINLLLIRAADNIDPGYLELFLRGLFWSGYWERICKKSVNQASVNQTDIKKTPFQYPPLEEQKQIVAKLDQCFEAIDKAKANATKNLENAKELFQSKLNDIFSQKGEGWVEKKLGEISDVTYGFTDKSVEVGDFRYVRITDIDNNGELISTGKKYIGSSKDGKKFILKDNDILMARTGATFAKLLLYKDIEPSIFASYLIKIDFTESIDNEFYWFYAKSNSYWDQANTLSTGSAQPHFNGKALKQVLFPYPVSKTEQSRLINEFKRFQSKTQSLESKYQQELNSLEELKKSILQKAFEGEL